MTKAFSRRIFLSGLASTASTAAYANAPLVSRHPNYRPNGFDRKSATAAEKLIDAASLGQGSKVGFVVADAQTGAVLEAVNPLLRQPPASVTKAITALYGLDRLGSGYQFQTRLAMVGSLSNGRLNGDLILIGGGDPTLNTDALGDMARDLKQAGVREITGGFKVFADALPHIREIDRGQPDHLGYNPAISGLNLNFNRVHFEWKRDGGGYNVTMDARAQRFRPRVAMSRMQIVDRRSPIYTYSGSDGRDNWTVAQRALGNGGSRWLPVRSPEIYAAEVFQTLARSNGIVLPNPSFAHSIPQSAIIVSHSSPEIRVILRDMLKYSTNLTAEVVGMTASASSGGVPGELSASAGEMMQWLRAGFGIRQAKFVDHSGLGEGSRISASEMVRMLVAVGPNGPLKPMLKNFRMRDANGRPVTDHPIEVKAKTGTLNFVSSLAGYIRTPGERELVFAIFTANSARRAQITREMRERPEGGRAWARRSRRLQQKLIDRWAKVHEA